MKKNINLGLVLLLSLVLNGCCLTLQSLEQSNGSVYIEQYQAPIDIVYKVTKSVVFQSPCNSRLIIYNDEINYRIYGKEPPIYWPGEFVWEIILESINKNLTKVKILWTPYIISGEGCTKALFAGIKTGLENL